MDFSTFQSNNLPRKYVKYKECSEGDILVQGTYLGTTENSYNKDRPNYVFKCGKEEVVLNTSGQLRYLIEEKVMLEVGEPVQVVYLGKDTIEKGKMAGKEAHRFDVMTAPGRENKNKVEEDSVSESRAEDLSDLLE